MITGDELALDERAGETPALDERAGETPALDERAGETPAEVDLAGVDSEDEAPFLISAAVLKP